jgi:hypothetical protein
MNHVALTLICSLPKVKRPAIWDSRSASYSEGAKNKVSLHTVCHVKVQKTRCHYIRYVMFPLRLRQGIHPQLIPTFFFINFLHSNRRGKRCVTQNKKKIN